MKNTSNNSKDFSLFKHKAKNGESYFLTILDDNGLNTINISKLNKQEFTFGQNPNNDIVLSSNFVDDYQGILKFTEYGILAVNTSLRVPMLGNNNKEFKDLYLSEGSFIKINSAVIMIMSIGKNMDEWQQYCLQFGKNTLGSSSSSDIIFPPNGVSKLHATIHCDKHKISIYDEFSINGVYVNNFKIPASQEVQLNNLDVIFIGNSKIILHGNNLIYQILQRGVRVDAIDICKEVRIKFKKRLISSHVNMTINPSEFVAFIGGSGAGKSTFMKCISGVDKATSGTVLVNGQNLYENYDTLKYNIGYVPQEDIVFSNLTLHDMLQYAAKLRMPDNTSRKERNSRIKEVLEIVQLSDFENSYIRQLSGGQRKRASIAVELIADPSLFFLDEPTSGLDPGTERSIMKTLQNMSQMGKTIILVTHNTLNLHLCDKVAFFANGGRLCFFGTPQEALVFFGVDDFVDIYNLINDNTSEWHEKFESTRPESTLPHPEINQQSNNIINKKKSFLRQLKNLISRYIKLISNDFMQILLLFAQAPIVAVLLSSVANSDLYSSYDDAKAIMFALGCASIWLGLMNSVQEICKEKVILQKEHMADLKLSAYLLSKFIVQGGLAFIQATLLISIFQLIVGQSEYSILINNYWDIQIICFLSILSSAALGLFISSLVRNSNIAMSIVPLILVPQLLFSGMLFKLEGISDFLSNFILCRWTVEGLGTSVNLNHLTHLIQTINPLATIEAEDYFIFTSDHMLQVIGVILLMSFVLMVASLVVLKKNVNKNM